MSHRPQIRPRPALKIAISLLAALLVASCQKTPPPGKGADSPEDLAKAYMAAVEKNDPEMFRGLLLTRQDMVGVLNEVAKHGEGTYQRFVINDFITKNKALLGKELKFERFELGPEIWTNGTHALHRASQLVVKTPEGKERTLEINFISRIHDKWKVFSLRYFKDLGPGGMDQIDKDLPDAKFNASSGADVSVKIKRLDEDGKPIETPTPTPKPSPSPSPEAPKAE